MVRVEVNPTRWRACNLGMHAVHPGRARRRRPNSSPTGPRACTLSGMKDAFLLRFAGLAPRRLPGLFSAAVLLLAAGCSETKPTPDPTPTTAATAATTVKVTVTPPTTATASATTTATASASATATTTTTAAVPASASAPVTGPLTPRPILVPQRPRIPPPT